MTVRHGPDRRFGDRVCWRNRFVMAVELEDYRRLDPRIDAGAPCDACGSELSYPLVSWWCGGRPLLLHPSCAREAVEGIMGDLKEIESARDDTGGGS